MHSRKGINFAHAIIKSYQAKRRANTSGQPVAQSSPLLRPPSHRSEFDISLEMIQLRRHSGLVEKDPAPNEPRQRLSGLELGVLARRDSEDIVQFFL